MTGFPRIIEFNGKSMMLCEWAKYLGVSATTMGRRLKSWPLEEALGTHGAVRASDRKEPEDTEPLGNRGMEIEAEMLSSTCGRCGLRGKHECLPDVDDVAASRTGESFMSDEEKRTNCNSYSYNGQHMSVAELAKLAGCSKGVMSSRLAKVTPEKAVSFGYRSQKKVARELAKNWNAKGHLLCQCTSCKETRGTSIPFTPKEKWRRMKLELQGRLGADNSVTWE